MRTSTVCLEDYYPYITFKVQLGWLLTTCFLLSKKRLPILCITIPLLVGAVEMKCLGKDCGGQGNEEKRPNPMMRMYTVHEPSPSSIEMTGYLLLTLMTSNKSTEALPFLRWLNSKRNSLGGWYSTQVCFHFVIIVQKSYTSFGAIWLFTVIIFPFTFELWIFLVSACKIASNTNNVLFKEELAVTFWFWIISMFLCSLFLTSDALT